MLEKPKREEYLKELEVDGIWIAKNENCPYGSIGIQWAGPIGFGEYTLILSEDGIKFKAHSEGMDETGARENKDFLKALLMRIVDMTEVES